MIPGLVSIVIPSRNEKYLQQTIQDLLSGAKGNIELIAVIDGYWPNINEFVDDKRVTYIHFDPARGMRNAINSAVLISKGEYLLKSDAHCKFEKGYDEILKQECKDDWIVVPRRFALNPVTWMVTPNPKYPIDYMYLSPDLHGEVWSEKNRNVNLEEIKIDNLMSSQGSCWFMKRSYYDYLELLDEENYGTFYNEFQEIGLKCWLSGGRIVVNKNTWYAHWHKPSDVGRGYSLDKGQKEKAVKMVRRWVDEKKVWHKQIHSVGWLVERFKPVPGWNKSVLPKTLSFFRRPGGTGEIRGSQVAERLKVKLNPGIGFENDICVYVKMQPPEDYPNGSYLDIGDANERLDWVVAHPDIGLIANSLLSFDYLKKRFPEYKIVLIPEHHCNFERLQRTRKEIKTVGVIGNLKSFQMDDQEISEKFNSIGLKFKRETVYKHREDIVNFYKTIDIQVVWRPSFGNSRWASTHLRNPLKIVNAGSFGIPTVAYPELDYEKEMSGYYIPVLTIDEMIKEVKKLKDNISNYKQLGEKVREKSEEYHIDNIIKLYKKLCG